MKKFLALLLAAMMLLATAGMALAEETRPTGQFKIVAPTSDVAHTYKVYQIFTGTLAEGNTSKNLGDLAWGLNSKRPDGVQVGDLVTDEQLSGLKGLADDANDAAILTEVLKLVVDPVNAQPMTTVTSGNTIWVDPGYYLITDTDNLDDVDDAATTHLVKVVYDLTVAPKSATPSVDKEVWDETTDSEDADGWGETADHEINESFQFKLTATLNAADDYSAYQSYKVVFTDTMSKGVTFEGIESVVVDGVPVAAANYTLSENAVNGLTSANDDPVSWTLTINDIKVLSAQVTEGEGDSATTVTKTVDLSDGAVIEVIYNAHLNEKAAVNVTAGATTNKNSVKLKYSNNPYTDGMGETGPDDVWVYTFQINNVKYKNSIDGANVLEGAGFTLYAGTGTTKTIVKLIENVDTNGKVTGTYTVAAADAVVTPDDATTSPRIVTEMISNANGKFDIIGLDAGTYTLEETKVPAGYNKCDDIVITITADHEEKVEGTPNTTLSIMQGDENYSGAIVNLPGASLPETGGIGTTLFYLFGSIMAAGSALILVVRRRADAEEE